MDLSTIDERRYLEFLGTVSTDADLKGDIEFIRSGSMGKEGRELPPEFSKASNEIGQEILEDGSTERLKKHFLMPYFQNFVFRLIKELYTPIHDIICSEKFKSKSVDTTIAGAQIAALTQVVVEYLNVSPVTALGIATALVLALMRSLQGTFCQFSQEEFLKRLDERVSK